MRVFAKLRAFDDRQGGRLTVQFDVQDLYAGHASQRSERAEYQGQRLAGIRQPPRSPPLNLDRARQFDFSERVQIQRENAPCRRPA